MNDADRRALELATLDIPLDEEGYRTLSECSALGQAALLLAMDESALEAWYEGAPDPVGPISRVLLRAVDRDDVADRIDAELAEDPSVLADLCRAQITWSHPVLPELLGREEFRGATAWMLSQTNPDPLFDWLEDADDPDQLLDVARHVAPSGVLELFEAISPWHEPVAEASTELAARLEAALFVLSPELWGRGFIAGQWAAGFLQDGLAMGDIIAAAGQTYWSAALGAFDPQSEEFSAIARMVVAGAAANLHFGPDEPGTPIIDAFYRETWSTLQAHPAFSAANVLAEEDSWRQPLLESAAHDVLLARAIDTPGIGGLPLSSSHPDADEIAAARALATQVDADPIVLVATMCDIHELRTIAEFEELPQHFAVLCDHERKAVATAASYLSELPPLADERGAAAVESAAGVAAAERIARRGDVDAVLTLIDLWADGPLLRAGLYAALTHQELRALSSIR